VPQLIISIILLKSKNPSQITILKASLIGAIVSNLHLLLGLGFLFGGLDRYWEQNFNPKTAATCGMLLLLATMGLMVPTISSLRPNTSQEIIVKISRGTAVVLLASYVLFVLFRLKSHKRWFSEKSQKSETRPKNVHKKEGVAFAALAHMGALGASGADAMDPNIVYRIPQDKPEEESEEEPEEPNLSLLGAFCTLIIASALLATHTEFATNNFSAIIGHVSSSFIGMVLLPLFAIDPGCITTSQKDKQDANVDNTLGKCIQTALVVTPIIVLLGWALDVPEMTLLFDNFEIGTLFLSVIIVNYITTNGKSNW
jgi:Ca2+:H+ antiporter